MTCSHCQSTNGKEKTGTSAKSGKPWRAWFCSNCKEPTWLEAGAPANPAQQSAPASGNPSMARIEARLALIERKLDDLIAFLNRNIDEPTTSPPF